MAHNDKIGFHLPSKVPDFFGGLTSHQFGHGIEAQLFQSSNALIEYLPEIIFQPNRCCGEGYLANRKVPSSASTDKRKTLAPHCRAKRAPSRSAVRPLPIRHKRVLCACTF